MEIIKAQTDDFITVRDITRTTINEIYPRYYPAGAVQFFLAHHSDEHIRADISEGKVFLLCVNEEPVGTVTISDNNINRLFVLPAFQHKGYGKMLLDFAEKKILESYDCVQIDASFPAKQIYIKRGYKEVEYNIIETENGDCLCYDVMRLEKTDGQRI
ncbi:MAG: GNAT family N-acetyltransferase [Saccharofermentans sp.]|nr:GNAT family N-acetyltransferase [Mageeibacillus sp.]MCI1264131.1 GNAT family N-acetyltransferase [Saccharofermentans sp.]MCI1274806.1 GNAT family N-acetyltransferase [Saccharofermentans sp.]